MTLEFGILGPLEIRAGDREVAVRGAKQRQLLALLLLNAGEVVTTERLIDGLWGDAPPPTAAKALQMHVSQLRKVLGADALVTHPRGYRLDVADEAVDARRFERLLSAGDHARALALWRGPVLVDLELPDELRGPVTRLEEQRLGAIEDSFDAALVAGEHAVAVAEVEAHVAAHPLRERPRAQLMLALYRCGRQADALAAYRDTRRVLVDELGIEPGRALRELEQRMLAQDPDLDLPAAAPEEELVGRDAELAELRAIVDRAVGGRGALVLIGGEPGIGKSRLADALARYADRRGATVAVGRCWEAGGAPPYWPWVQALRELGAGQAVPELETEPDAGSSRFRLFAAVAAALREAAATRPVAVFLDDLHAADQSSLLLLQYVAAEVARERLAIVGCYRDTEPGPLAALLPDLAREPAVRRMTLGGLEPADIAVLLERTAGSVGLAERVHAQTEGNPLFAVEIGRLLVSEGDGSGLPIPAGVIETITRRLEPLSDGCRAVLLLASVLGREFDVDVVGAVSGLPEQEVWAALEEAAAGRLVGDVPGTPGRMRFAHMLTRDAVYGSLTGVRQTRLHRQVAEALESLYAAEPEPHLDVLAHHFQLAGGGVAERAATYSARAGDRAARQFGYAEAARHYHAALAALGADPERRCELLLSRGEALSRAGDEQESKRALREAARLAEEQGRPERLARAAIAYGGSHWARSSTDPALVPLLERALAAVGDDDRSRALLLARLADARRDDRDRGPRLALADEAVALAERVGDPATLLFALSGRWIAAEGPDSILDTEAGDRMVALSLRLGDKEREFMARELRLVAYWSAGDRAALDVEVDALAALVGELRQAAGRWALLTCQTMLALMEGRFDDAERLIAEASGLGGGVSSWNTAVSERVGRFVLHAEQGRLAEIADVIDRSVHEFPAQLRFRCAQAHISATLGHEEQARAQLGALIALDLRGEHVDAEWLFSLCVLADPCARLGDAEAAAALHALLEPYAHLYAVAPVEAVFGSVAGALGRLAATAGDLGAAERHYRAALAIEGRMRARPWLERVERELAALRER